MITCLSGGAAALSDLAMATVPGAVFSVWHNISGAVLASLPGRYGPKAADQESADCNTDSGTET